MNEGTPDGRGSRFQELKRRKLFQWGLAYLAGAFAVLQLLDILAEHFTWPAVITRGAIILIGFGFFVALVLAWYHGEHGRQHVSGAELLMVAGILAVAGAAIAMANRGSDRAGPGAEASAAPDEASVTADVPADPIPSRSIAVLPLDDHSADPRHAYFAAAMTEEITSALARVPELRVSARNSAAKFADSGRTVGEFAMQELRVAHVLEGSVQLRDARARITVQLIDAAGTSVGERRRESACRASRGRRRRAAARSLAGGTHDRPRDAALGRHGAGRGTAGAGVAGYSRRAARRHGRSAPRRAGCRGARRR